ncbi:MAG: MFS transporter [Candidatus Sericytochromatia bacterium]
MTTQTPPAPTADAAVRRNYALNVGEGVAVITAAVFFSQSAILPLFVARHTDATWALSLIPVIAILGVQLPQLFGAAIVAKSADFRATFLRLGLLPRLAMVALALAPWLPGQWALVGLFLAFGLSAMASGAHAPCWYEFVSHVVPKDLRGRFFGDRNALGGLTGLAALGTTSWLLQALPYPANFSACFAVAAALWFVSYGCMWATRYDWTRVDAARADAQPFWDTAVRMLREHEGFRRYVAARWLVSGSIMGVAFYVIFAQRHFQLTAAQSSLLALAMTLLPGLLGMVWGRLIDRVGLRRVQVPAAIVGGLACWLLLMATSLPVYALGLFLIGCANMIFMIGDSKWLTELDPARCGTVVSCFNLAMCPAAVGFSLAAGLIAQVAGMPVVFFLTGVAWLAGAALVAWALGAPRAATAEVAARVA